MDGQDLICTECGGPGYALGQLGNLTWCRCRDCAATFDAELPQEYANQAEGAHGNAHFGS